MSPEDPASEVSWGLEARKKIKRSLRKIGSSKTRSQRLFSLPPGSGIFHQLLFLVTTHFRLLHWEQPGILDVLAEGQSSSATN